MPRGLLAHELFLAIAELPDNQEVTARFIDVDGDEQDLPIYGVDSSHASAAILLADAMPTEADAERIESLKAITELLDVFENKHLQGPVPLPPLPILDALETLIEEIRGQLADE